MPTGSALTPPTQTLHDALAAKKTIRELEFLYSPPVPQAATDHDCDVESTVPRTEDVEDEYTLCAYGDISLSEVIVPPTHPSPGSLHSRFPQPHLRLKVRRPPMPKRRPGYTFMSDPLHGGGVKPDAHWPGSPRHFINNPPWLQHQPLISPVSATPPTTLGNKPPKNGGSSLEKLVDELLPHSPSIRLSPSCSPATQAISLSQETYNSKSGVQRGRNVLKADDAAKPLQSSPTPASPQDKPREPSWRTRLPPRLPIPKWDT